MADRNYGEVQHLRIPQCFSIGQRPDLADRAPAVTCVAVSWSVIGALVTPIMKAPRSDATRRS